MHKPFQALRASGLKRAAPRIIPQRAPEAVEAGFGRTPEPNASRAPYSVVHYDGREGSIFARKGEASPAIDRRNGGRSPEEVVAEHRAIRALKKRQAKKQFSEANETTAPREEALSRVKGSQAAPVKPASVKPAAVKPASVSTPPPLESRQEDSAATLTYDEAVSDIAFEKVSNQASPPQPEPDLQPEPSVESPPTPVSDFAPERSWLAVRRRQTIRMMSARFEAMRASGNAVLQGPGARAAASFAGDPAAAVKASRPARARLYLSLRDYMRLTLAASVLGLEEEDLAITALNAYFDACGVETFDDYESLGEPGEI